jgi:CheY-like chemotaxis protein
MSRILVVDDESIIRMLLADALTDAGYLVATASNGAEALDRAIGQRSDAVLLDLLMPVMDGFAFLRERMLQPDLARVPVVVLSAAGIEGLRQAARLRATAVLGKPLDLDVVSAVVEHVLRQWTTSLRIEPRGRPIGTCPICDTTAYADIADVGHTDRFEAIRTARIQHVLNHSAAEIADVPIRKRLLQLPLDGRRRLASWFYRELRQDWGDLDRRGVHSIDQALDSPALHRLWHEAVLCGAPNCRHDN